MIIENVVVLPDGRFFEKEKVASIDVDVQKTFSPLCPKELPVPGATEIVDELNAQAKLVGCRILSKEAHSKKAVWVATEQEPQLSLVNGKNVDVRWNMHGEIGTCGFELLDGLPAEDSGEYNYIIWKGIELNMHPYGICYHDPCEMLSTGVIEYLWSENPEKNKEKVELVVVGGLATEYCVKLTVLQFLRAGFVVVVNLGACRGINQDDINKAIKEMKEAGAIFINSVNELKNFFCK